jgi:hypothetical protein
MPFAQHKNTGGLVDFRAGKFYARYRTIPDAKPWM